MAIHVSAARPLDSVSRSPYHAVAMKNPGVLSQNETIELLLERSKRATGAVPIRKAFVQQGSQASPKPGPLAALVHSRDPRALQLYLLVLAVCSGGDYSVTEWAATWGRTVGLFSEQAARAAVSRGWRRLEDLTLIARDRGAKGRSQITLLSESGNGEAYTPPKGDGDDRYLKLPFSYWTAPSRWYEELSLPAKAVLLIGLSLPTKFQLPQEKGPTWYGVSADTVGRGLGELRERGLLEIAETSYFKTLESPTGYAPRNLYRLLPPFEVRRATRTVKPAKPKTTTSSRKRQKRKG